MQLLIDDLLDLGGGTDGDRTLGHHQHIAVDVLPDGAGNIEDVLQVGAAILVGWGADGAEDDVHLIDDVLKTRRETQSARLAVLVDQCLKSRLIDGNLALVQGVNFLFVDIDAGHVYTHFAETGAGDESDISSAYNRDFHMMMSCFKMHSGSTSHVKPECRVINCRYPLMGFSRSLGVSSI